MIAEKEVVLTFLLQLLSERGVLERLAFKGGTCLRKMFVGSQGRFSTDLDFTGLEEHDHEDVILEMMQAFEQRFRALRLEGFGRALSPNKRYALVVLSGKEPGKVIPIDKARVTIGRSGCDVVLDDTELSRQHALIAISGAGARLEDLGSTNGTYVGETRIQQASLEDRSEFRIGAHELLFVMTDREGPPQSIG
jgi:hypothetical protein